MPKVAITVDNRKPIEAVFNVFKEAGIDVVYKACDNEDDVIATAKDADAILVGHSPDTTRRVMQECTKVKAVSRNGVGVDTVDLKAATELGVCVCNTPAINGPEVTDHALALLLAMTRKITEVVRIQNEREWSHNPTAKSKFWGQMRRIAGSTIGIYGFGNIGRNFALTVRGFGPHRILAHDSYVRQINADTYGVEMVDMDTLLRESDIISLHAPATAENDGIFNYEAFSKMKNDALFVNCARGALVDEPGLIRALKEGQIAGAATDVLRTEPPKADDPMYDAPNLIISPHLAGGSNVTSHEGSIQWAENVAAILVGKRPHSVVNRAVTSTIVGLRAANDPRWEGFRDPLI